MSRREVLLVTAAECLVLVWSARHWWRVHDERNRLVTAAGWDGARSAGHSWRERLDVLARRTRAGRSVADRLDRTAAPLTVVEAVALAVVTSLAVAWSVATLLTRTFALVWLALTPFVAGAVIDSLIRRRAASMVEQLPELSTSLAGAAAAGLSLPAALRVSADDLPDPIAGELRRALDSFAVGLTTEAALREIARRLPSRELDLLITTLVIQARGGGNLVQALRRLSETLERRRDIRREVTSLTAGSTSSAYLMVFFGLAITTVLQRTFPGSLDRTLASPLGLLAIVVSATLYVIGIVLIRRLGRARS